MPIHRDELDIQTPDGVSHAFVYRGGDGARPGVLLCCDAFGVRPSMHGAAERLAGLGYVVLLPNLFFRSGEFPPFDQATAFTDPVEKPRLMAILGAVKPEPDTGAYLEALAAWPGVHGQRLGTMGYCMGGRLAFLAAALHPERVRATACFHPGGLATSAPDSPHTLAGRIQGAVYVGLADEDRGATPEQQGKLAAALGEAHVDYRLEVYRGKKHGYAVRDSLVHDRDAADRHWKRAEAFFKETLG